jgi:hypothetical protein
MGRYWLFLLRAQWMAAASLLRARARGRSRSCPSFVLLSRGRTGSTLLVDLLNCHPLLCCDGEILSHRLFVAKPEVLVRSRARLHPSHVYGFKLRPMNCAAQGIASPGRFLADLHAEGWRFLHLRRRNHVRTALSTLRRAHTGIVHQRVGETPPPPRRIHVRPSDLLNTLARTEHETRLVHEWLDRLPCLTLVYEDDLLNAETRQPALDRAFAYLGLEPAPVGTRYVRLSSDRLEDVVENHEEIVSFLADTQYAPYVTGKETVE